MTCFSSVSCPVSRKLEIGMDCVLTVISSTALSFPCRSIRILNIFKACFHPLSDIRLNLAVLVRIMLSLIAMKKLLTFHTFSRILIFATLSFVASPSHLGAARNYGLLCVEFPSYCKICNIRVLGKI